MEVAIPCTRRAAIPSRVFVVSSPLFPIPSFSILPPINRSKTSAIHGMHLLNTVKYRMSVWTHIQPIIGMTA